LTEDDVVATPITLDRDWVKVEAGGIITIRDIEVRLGYGQILWGQNIPKIQSFNLGLIYKIDNLTGELDSEPGEQEGEPVPSEPESAASEPESKDETPPDGESEGPQSD
jgi:hypothetical protein